MILCCVSWHVFESLPASDSFTVFDVWTLTSKSCPVVPKLVCCFRDSVSPLNNIYELQTAVNNDSSQLKSLLQQLRKKKYVSLYFFGPNKNTITTKKVWSSPTCPGWQRVFEEYNGSDTNVSRKQEPQSSYTAGSLTESCVTSVMQNGYEINVKLMVWFRKCSCIETCVLTGLKHAQTVNKIVSCWQ